MRKTGWFVAVVGVVVACAVVAVGSGAVWNSPPTPPPPPAATGWARTEPPAQALVATVAQDEDQVLIKELTKLLDETKSLDTFAITASALCKMGPKARMALPSIIRNAERLKLLDKHLLSEKDTRKKKMLEGFGEGLALLLPELKSTAKDDGPAAAIGGGVIGAAAGTLIGSVVPANPLGVQEQSTPASPLPPIDYSDWIQQSRQVPEPHSQMPKVED